MARTTFSGPVAGGTLIIPLLARKTGIAAVQDQQFALVPVRLAATHGHRLTGGVTQTYDRTSDGGDIAIGWLNADGAQCQHNEVTDIGAATARPWGTIGAPIERNIESDGFAHRWLARGDSLRVLIASGGVLFLTRTDAICSVQGHAFDPDNQAPGASQDFPYVSASD